METLNLTELKGKFHCHITYEIDNANEVKPPHSWKSTIVTLSKAARTMDDFMITKHYVIPSEKTPDLSALMSDVHNTTIMLMTSNKVLRVKIEHESLPTVSPSQSTYREVHIRVLPYENGYPADDFVLLEDWVRSSTQLNGWNKQESFFVNRRFYSGSVEKVDAIIYKQLDVMKLLNPHHRFVEVKIESTIYDTNLYHDKWWA
jgi:hypothetical protein